MWLEVSTSTTVPSLLSFRNSSQKFLIRVLLWQNVQQKKGQTSVKLHILTLKQKGKASHWFLKNIHILSSGVPTMIPLILISGSRRRGIGPNEVNSGTSSKSLNLCIYWKGKKIQIVKFNMNAFNGESVSGENAIRDANCLF